MEIAEAATSVVGAAGTSGALVVWFIKRTVTEIFDDLKGLSIKIDKVDDKYQAKICDLEIEIAKLKAQADKK